MVTNHTAGIIAEIHLYQRRRGRSRRRRGGASVNHCIQYHS